MPQHYTYFLILAGSLIVPLLLSFDKKVAFYKSWKFLFPAMLFPAVVYIIWDAYFTKMGVWSFNENYITGFKLFGLPIEEILFFFVVPYCCVFIYQCIKTYFPNLHNRKTGRVILQMIAVLLLLVVPFFYDRNYTLFTFVLLAVAIIRISFFKKTFYYFSATYFLLSYAVILIPFLIVNGLLTRIPVVLYNDAENMGVRLTTIPVEDIFYGMLLVLLNVVIYEWLKDRAHKKELRSH